jgi:GAF domain-containing protein
MCPGMPPTDSPLERHLAAMHSMARAVATHVQDPQAAYRHLTEGCARGLEVDRVSIWRFEGLERSLRLLDLYDARTNAHMAGTLLNAVDFPVYFQEMWAGRVIDAENAREDPRTMEFRASYLEPLDIIAMLDVPLKGQGKLTGVLCNEHRHPRTWPSQDVRLATFTASLATVVMDALDHHTL